MQRSPRQLPHARTDLRFAALYAACWVPLVVIYIGVLTASTAGQMSIVAVTIAALLNTLGPALLGIAVWWISGRVPLTKRIDVPFVGVHILLAGAFVSAWMAWEFLILGPFGPTRPPDSYIWRYVLPWQGVVGVALYVVVAAVSYAVRGVLAISRLATAAEIADSLRTEAELAALRAHLDPHFLFNTLRGVMQLLRDDPAHAEEALERLADLLRFILHLDRSGVRVVTLEAGWRFVPS
jgi:ABC-type multidrug transport system fused ATPase/permease subunit